jgi:hypothetical protein
LFSRALAPTKLTVNPAIHKRFKMKFKLSLIAAALAVSGSAVAAPNISGQLELNIMGNRYSNNYEYDGGYSNSGTLPGIGATGLVSFGLSDSTRIVVQQQSEYLFNDDSNDMEGGPYLPFNTPTQVNLLTARLEQDFSIATVALFGGIGSTHHYFDDGVGNVWGASAMLNLHPAASVYLTLGKADIRIDGDNSGFTGTFGEVGGVFTVADAFAIKPYYGYGKASDGFTYDNESGKYRTFGVKASYKLGSGSSYLTAGYEDTKYDSENENTGNDKRFTLGVAIPFGSQPKTHVQILNPMSTSLTPFKAASYGLILSGCGGGGGC